MVDSFFLIFVVTASFLPYITGLGFYSDDWAFLGVLSNSDDQSILGLVHQQFASNDVIRIQARPTQIAYQAVLYRAFGLEPLGYHLFNAAIFAAIATLGYQVLRELRLPRVIALSFPVLFLTMPNYSTDRFWFAAFHYGVSLAFFLLSLVAGLRATRATGTARAGWISVSVLAVVISALGNETILPLFLFSLSLIQIHTRLRFGEGLSGRLGPRGTLALVGGHILVLASVLVYKLNTAEFFGTREGVFLHLRRLVFGSLITNAGSYGVGLPAAAWWGSKHVEPWVLGVGILLGAIVFAYLFRVGEDRGAPVSVRAARRPWTLLCLAGIVVFVLGYSVFLTTSRVIFTSTGIGNRVAMMPSVGVAAILVGAVGLVSTMLRTPSGRRACFAGLVAVLSFLGFVTTSALGSFWRSAWIEERTVLADIDRRLPTLEPHTSLVVHGVCPYRGPAIVFESNWDLAGALQTRHRDLSLTADVTGRMTIEEEGLSFSLYGGWSWLRPYGEDLLLYDRDRGVILRLLNARTALRYFGSRDPSIPSRCPDGSPGQGEIILPGDRLYLWMELRDFRP